MHTLYKLVFASGKAYIGQTVRAMDTRIAQHRRAVKSGSQLPVHCAWRKHGEPSVSVIAEFETHDQLHAAEIATITALDTVVPNGYNLSFGGETAPSKNPEVAAKIAKKATGRKHEDTSSWVEASTKKWQDAEYREKVLEGVKASWTDEKRAARSEMAKKMWAARKAAGWKMPESTKEKLRQKEFSAETRAKMSESAKKRGAPLLSEEARKKISEKTTQSWLNSEIRAKRIQALKKIV